MALRGSSTRRSTDSPLAGVLRDLGQRTRRLESRGQRPARRGPAGERGPRGLQGRPGAPAVAAVVTTGPDGRAVWYLSDVLLAEPVVGAIAVAAGEDGPLVVVVEEAGTDRVVVRVWRLEGVPAGAGVEVHLTATPRRAG